MRHSENRFSLLFDAADVPDEILKRLENFPLPLARDQCGSQIPIRDDRIAHLVRVLALVVHVSEAIAPMPVCPQPLFGDFSAPRQDELVRAHVCRHHSHEIVWTQNSVDQPDQRLGNRVGVPKLDVSLVQEDHEHAVARVLGRLQHLPLRRGLDALRLRARRADDDVLERVDFLGHSVLENLEVGGRQILYRFAGTRRIHVDPNEIGAGPKRRRTLIRCLG